MKKALSILLSLCLILTAIPLISLPVGAEEPPGDWELSSSVFSQEGSEDDPYLIYTLEDLEAFRDEVNKGYSYAEKHIKLMSDIVMNEPDMFAYDDDGVITGAAEGKTPYEWTPVGTDNRAFFSGVFDGNGHKIIGIYINSVNEYQGLFGYIATITEYATVKNLGVVDGYIKGSKYVGGVVGCNHASGNGIGTVLSCYNTCTVCGGWYSNIIGGIVGYNSASTSGEAVIRNCYNAGRISNDGRGCYQAAGIAGYNHATSGSSTAVIEGCYNTGTVTGYARIAGIATDNTSEYGNAAAIIKDCYNAGTVTTGGSDSGGIAASNCSRYDSASASITNCYNVGSVSGYVRLGGITGNSGSETETNTANISFCYYLDTSADDGSSFGMMYTEEQMRNAERYEGFDFDEVWTMEGDPDYPYPELIAFNSDTDNGAWDGSIADSFESGNGTENDPYVIKTAAQLAYLAQSTNAGNAYSGEYFILANDITLNDPDMFARDEDGVIIGAAEGKTPYEWTPIGTYISDSDNKPFKGTFDGNGHKILGVYINSDNNNQGLFGYCKNATVDSLGVVDGYIRGASRTGGVIASIESESGNTLVINCYNTCVINTNSFDCGGVIGYSNAKDGVTRIVSCFNSGSIIGNCIIVGGVIGMNASSGGKAVVEKCYNSGSVNGKMIVGGFAGENLANATNAEAILFECYNIGSVNGSFNEIGGVVADNIAYNGRATVSSCYNAGLFGGNGSLVGGIAGRNEADSGIATLINCYNTSAINADIGSPTGGIVAYNHATNGRSSASIESCYNIGEISNISNRDGGIVGWNNTSRANSEAINRNCYYHIGASLVGYNNPSSFNGSIITENITPLSGTQMCSASSFIGFDFDDVWTMEGSLDYPYPELQGMLYAGEYEEPAPFKGSGYEDNPYQIFTLADLELFRDNVNAGESYEGEYFKLMNDIIMNESDMFARDEDGVIIGAAEGKTPYEWTPIGISASICFAGNFDGNGHTVSGIYIDSEKYNQGLFGYCVNATIKDIGTTEGYVKGTQSVGGVIGYVSANSGMSEITSCFNTASIYGSSSIGGVAGYIYATSDISSVIIDHCNNSGRISGNSIVGGVVGYNSVSSSNSSVKSIVTNCYNTGAITGNNLIGGIAGYNWSSNGTTIITECYNTGTVSGNKNNIGGIAGNNYTYNGVSTVSNSFNISSVSGSSNVGGIAGYSISQGGTASVSCCYNIGLVSGSTNLGGIAGYSKAEYQGTSAVTDCYYLDSCIDGGSDYGSPLTDRRMRSTASFIGFDFDEVWTMEGNQNYPYPELIEMPFVGEYTYTDHESDFEGSGTEDDPYLIYTLADLELFRDKVNEGESYEGVYFKLMNDIVMNDSDMFAYDDDGVITGAAEGKAPYEWTPIGTYDRYASDEDNHPFSGSFDGNEHQIVGIYINGGEGVGVFGYNLNAAVKNLVVVVGYIHGYERVGGIVGYNAASYGNSAVLSCYNSCTVCGGRYNNLIGGIVGYNYASYEGEAVLKECYNTGRISNGGRGSWRTAGVAGSNHACYGTARVIIEKCYNAGYVTGNGRIAGIATENLAEYGSTVAIITDCYNTGMVHTGGSDSGGIAANNIARYDSASAEIKNCYNIGTVSGYIRFGGITGENSSDSAGNTAAISNCYYLDTSCVDSALYGISLSNAQLRSAASFIGFDFDEVWTMEGNPVYPYPELQGIPISGYDILGDADNDGKVTILDATVIQRKLASLPVASYNEKAADTDIDGKVTILDATRIQRWLAGFTVNAKIGEPIR